MKSNFFKNKMLAIALSISSLFMVTSCTGGIYNYQGTQDCLTSFNIKTATKNSLRTLTAGDGYKSGDTYAAYGVACNYLPNTINPIISYSSSDSTIATIDENGHIIAQKEGTCTITAKPSNYNALGLSDSFNITVNKYEGDPLMVTFADKEVTLDKGETKEAKYTVWPDTANSATTLFNFTSSDTAYASVSTAGVVKAVKKGEADISIALKSDETVKDSMKVTIKQPTTGASFSKSIYSVYVNSNVQTTVNTTPVDSDYTKYTYSIKDSTIATVNTETGEVSGVKYGTTTLTATNTHDSKITCTTQIQVNTKITSVDITDPSKEVNVGKTIDVKYTYLPANTRDTEFKFTSNHEDIAVVSTYSQTEQTVTIKGVKEGTARITMTSTASYATTVTDYIDITVKEVKLTKLEFAKASYTLNYGDTTSEYASNTNATEFKIPYVTTPTDASYCKVTATLSNTDNFKVTAATGDQDKYVVITPTTAGIASGGSATLTIKSEHYSTLAAATTTITLLPKITSVSVSKSSVEFSSASTQTVSVTYNPTNAWNKGKIKISDVATGIKTYADATLGTVSNGSATISIVCKSQPASTSSDVTFSITVSVTGETGTSFTKQISVTVKKLTA